MARPIPQAAIDLVKAEESLRLEAYRDASGVWTNGYGHTKGVYKGQMILESEANAWLASDLAEAGEGVEKSATVVLSDNEFAALVDFVFNVGIGHLQSSRMLKVLNEGYYCQVPDHLVLFNKAGGQVLNGLAKRRAAEILLWNTL